MRLTGQYDEEALHLLGASRIEEVRDEAGKVIGHAVDEWHVLDEQTGELKLVDHCKIDMAGYGEAAGKAAEARASRPPLQPPLTNDELAALRTLLKSAKV
jgi:hypothetical protein